MAKTKRGLPDMTWIPGKKLWRKRGSYKEQSYSITAKTPEEVVERINAFKVRVDSGIIDEKITFWQYVQRWYPLRVAGLKPKSKEAVSNVINNHILPKLGNLLIKDVKPLHIDELLAGLSESSSSLNQKVLIALNQIFESAIENNIINKNPCKGRKAGGERTKPKIPLTKEQQETLTNVVRGTRAELFVLLCLYAGLRREEALGILWSNVHLDVPTPYLDVRHTTTFESNGTATHSPDLKSPAAYRSIPLPPQLIDALTRWRGTKNSMFVIPAENTGKEMSQTAFRRMWGLVVGYKGQVVKRDETGKKVLMPNGTPVMIEKRYPGLISFHTAPHILRHTYITRLCASGMDIKKIQYLAGHEDARITLNIYAKVTENQPGELAPDIISAFSRTPTGTPNIKSK